MSLLQHGETKWMVRMKEKIIRIFRPNFPGIVVQSVRAPPCQGGSCGFEPRQSRPRLGSERRSISLSIFCEEERQRVGSNSQQEDPSFVSHFSSDKSSQGIQMTITSTDWWRRDICRLVQSGVSPYSGFKEIAYWSGFFRLFLIHRIE